MSIFSFLLIVLGLSLFEIISSIDNAIINAEVLSTMKKETRKWFLSWGLLIAVFVVRGGLPWLIVWLATPGLGPMQALTATFSNDPHIKDTIEQSAPVLLLGGGVFLLFVFYHWLFMEEKKYGLPGERFFQKQGVWFYAVVSIILSIIVWFSIHENPYMALSAVFGSSAFFIVHGFRENAKEQEQKLLGTGLSELSKILYLEIIDASFSIDGVLGAFAFTLSVLVILIGNGFGAILLRQLTISNMDRIKKYRYLKNGAMYSVLFLGMVMVLEAFGLHVPAWFTPLSTISIVLYFFYRSNEDQLIETH